MLAQSPSFEQEQPGMVTSGVPVQAPAVQTSSLVQYTPSSQGAVLFALTQPPCDGSQTSSVQGSPSLQ